MLIAQAVGVLRDPVTGVDTIYNGLVSTTPSAANTSSSSSAAGATPVSNTVIGDPSKLFYGTQMCYIFMRLHHALYVRLHTAKVLAAEMQAKRLHFPSSSSADENDTDLHAHTTSSLARGGFSANGGLTLPGMASAADNATYNVYTHFLGQVHSLVEGSMDNARFEDFCRMVLGNKSYVLYTLDKIISQMMKHLQAMANDDNVNKLIGLFVYHHSNPKGVDSVVYQQHVAHILSHTMEDVFRIQLLSPPRGCITEGKSEVGIQHLGILPVTSTPAQIATALNTINAASTSTADVLMDVVDSVAPESGKPLVARRSGSISLTANDLSDTSKVPKAVVSDDEDDDSEEEDDEAKSAVPSVEVRLFPFVSFEPEVERERERKSDAVAM